MSYAVEKWVPRQKPVDVFLINLEALDELGELIGATSVRTAYNRGGTILIEWTMMHRETFAGLVGQYIVRDRYGELEVLDTNQLMSNYEPFMEKTESEVSLGEYSELGKLLAVHAVDGAIDEVLFELPDGSPATFVIKNDEDVEEIDTNETIDGDPNKEKNDEQEHKRSE